MSYDEHLISMAGGDGEPDLDAIQARADAATEGPWCLTGEPEEVKAVAKYTSANGISTGTYIADIVEIDADAEFIAHARTDVPALLAVVRSQQAKIERVEALACELVSEISGESGVEGECLDEMRSEAAKRIRAALTATEATV